MDRIPLELLKNKHKCEKIFVFGSGPSLDTFDMHRIDGRACVCMNESIEVVKGPVYEFNSVEPIRYWVASDTEKFDAWRGTPPDCIPVLAKSVIKNLMRDRPQNNPDNGHSAFVEVTFHGVGDNYEHGMPEHIITSRTMATELNTIYMNYGTASSACYLAWYLGAGEVELVGVDGGVGNAKIIKPHYPSAFMFGRQCGHKYDLLRKCGIRVLDCLGVKWTDTRKGDR